MTDTPRMSVREILDNFRREFYKPIQSTSDGDQLTHEERVTRQAEAALETLLNEREVSGRLNEAFLIGVKQEKGEYLPATYLIDRKAELSDRLKDKEEQE